MEYYYHHFEVFREYLNNINEDLAATRRAQEVINDDSLRKEVVFLQENSRQVHLEITALEERLSLLTRLRIVENLTQDLKEDPFKTKLKEVLQKNPG
uniref:Putative LOC100897181 [Metaseiulus occidentalis] n=1 Tax=Lepeophtheirus salmonis TaxID=72036 RepID=A0A0K2UMJ3_LEPSM